MIGGDCLLKQISKKYDQYVLSTVIHHAQNHLAMFGRNERLLVYQLHLLYHF